jgi:hypothetical protein
MKTIVLPGERPTSWNRYYSGAHWSKRRDEVDRVRQVVRAALTGDETPYQFAVKIIITAYFDKHPLDCDNLAAKLYIDALKGWLILDDTMQCVKAVTTRSLIDKQNPRVEIAILE